MKIIFGLDSLDKVQLADDPRNISTKLLEVKYFKSITEDKGVRLLAFLFQN